MSRTTAEQRERSKSALLRRGKLDGDTTNYVVSTYFALNLLADFEDLTTENARLKERVAGLEAERDTLLNRLIDMGLAWVVKDLTQSKEESAAEKEEG